MPRLARPHAVVVVAFCLLAASSARAVPVIGTFQTIGGDYTSSDGIPAPLLLPPVAAPPYAGRFTYDTDRVTSVQRYDANDARYVFTQDATLAVVLGGHVYSTTASPTNPIQIDVGANVFGDDYFRITPLGQAPDPSNPLAAFPRLSMVNGYRVLPSSDLPTASFAASDYPDRYFDDPEVFVRSVAPPGPVGYYNIWQFVVGTVDITVLPEPAVPVAIWLLGLGMILATRRTTARRLS